MVADDGTILSMPEELINCAKGFYCKLYSTEQVSPQATDFLLSQLPDTVRLDDSQQTLLLTEWTDDEVEACLAHTSTHSSPGIDGLPLFCDMLNTALTEHFFPATWQRSVVTLLPKKGDRRHLKNWRPISLICADAKVFTRLLANRLGGIVPVLLIPHQIGFLAERFIADSGLVTRLTVDIARRYRLPGIALLLDQEKAYDRVHPTYLRTCLLRFGFPTQFVECITSLFFNTSLCVKVNGFLSTTFTQERSLRQGDPLSPFLFNLALEPLLRAIHTYPLLPGFRFHDPAFSQMPRPIGRPPVLKLLAYADDVLVFLKDQIELTSLLALINAYELASNAKLNLDKTIAVSLSGHSQPLWRHCLQHRGITHWHDSSSHVAAIYLGFPLTSSSAQLTAFLDEMLGSTRLIVHRLAFRRLSVQGRGLIANTLILSRVWHSLHVLAVPAYFLDKIRSIVDQFINSKSFPKVSFDTCRRPRKEGGLTVLDPATQLHALHFSGSSSPVLPLAFAELRSPDVQAMGCCKLLFRVMDMLDFSVNWEALNISLVLEIPVSRIYLSLPTFNGRGRRTNWGQLRMKDVFKYNPIHNCLRRRPHLSSTRFKHRVSRFYSLLADGQSPVHPSIGAFFTPQNLRTDSQLQYTLYRLPQPNFKDMLTVELPGAMDFDHITLKLFRTSKLLPIDALPAHYPSAHRALEILPSQAANTPASSPDLPGSTFGSLLPSMWRR
ncbi:hypothetical protein G6F17_011095 [Rhizopus arrhizus]|nr:hypothetical protein G6F17_011095 [Rhizopus arrhizus]KAG0909647.1 hypothetical protein G6F33_008587 [Rhizopus arrhizus]